MIILAYIIFAFIVAAIGSSRSIGFLASLFFALLLSPVIGLIIVLCSERLSNIRYKNEMLNLQRKQADPAAYEAQQQITEKEINQMDLLKVGFFVVVGIVLLILYLNK